MTRIDAAPHQYRADVDGLRAVAVLAVIGFHAAPKTLPGGFVGVDVFFVISGFLISGLILNGLRDGTFSYVEFYSRRVRRLFPALIVVLLATCGSERTMFVFIEKYNGKPLVQAEGQGLGWFRPDESRALKMPGHDHVIIERVTAILDDLKWGG